MKKNPFVLISFLSLCLLLACGEKPAAATSPQDSKAAKPAANGPTIKLSTTRAPQGGHIYMTGSGFTPNSDAISHLKKPDGTEYNPIIMLTNEKGEIEHDIESFLLPLGELQVWIVDVKTGKSSNVAKFETTMEQPK
jgi:hypothetical protein